MSGKPIPVNTEESRHLIRLVIAHLEAVLRGDAMDERAAIECALENARAALHENARDVVDVAAVRQAVADYMRSEGCSCCRGGDHGAHAKALALLLDVPAYADKSGYDYDQFATGGRNG